jgi:asparagine synthase (glutamine-hydrolysing)
MCGLCGIVYRPSAKTRPDPELVRRMTATMRHRGPDAEGLHSEGPAALGHCRLSIIDLAGGAQPMSSSDGKKHLVFNGEIYNFLELREQLERQGHRFKTRSDTEVILHLYDEYREGCVEHLRGMFAFALWDSEQESLFLARDRFGKKPLVYALLSDQIVFGSEIKALLEHPAVGREIDYSAIDLFLTYQYIPSPWTIYQSIRKLPPAHTLLWKDGQIRLRRYWEPTFIPETSLSFQEAQEQMLATLKEATRLRMIADVPIGAFLSGGLDSSIVVGLMSELSSQPIRTFSIGFEEQEFSELAYARMVAKRFGTQHQEFVVKPDAIDILPKLAWHYGEPYADSSALPSFYLAKLTREHVTVSLNGDGGDETFAGYPRYQAMVFLQGWLRIPLSLRRKFFEGLHVLPDGHPPYSLSWRLKRLFGLGLMANEPPYLRTLCFFRETDKQNLYSPFMKSQTQGASASAFLQAALDRAQRDQGINRYLHTDMLTYLPECLMVKMDIASMAYSLETRSPFLDHKFVELVARFPSSWKLRCLLQSKYIIRQAVKGWLPNPILKRRKQGFGTPISHWFRNDLKPYLSEMLLSDKSLSRGLFDKSAVQNLLEAHWRGFENHSYRLWGLLMLELWHRVYVDKEYRF